jgi:hypothetical protein
MELTEDDQGKKPQLEQDLAQARKDIDQLRLEVRTQAAKTVDNAEGEKVPDPINLSKAFVSFKQSRQAQICLNLQFNSDSSVYVASVPPEPRDMLWNDLTADPTVQAARDVIGYALVVGLYFAYMPLVIGIHKFLVQLTWVHCNLCGKVSLQQWVSRSWWGSCQQSFG